MAELSIDKKKELAKQLYLSGVNSSQKEIAMLVGVTEATMSKWITNEKWKGLKENLLLTREEQLSGLYQWLKTINAHIGSKEPEQMRFPDKNESKIIKDLSDAINKLEVDLRVSEKIEVCKEIMAYLRHAVKFDESQRVAYLLNEFIKSLIR